MFTSLPLVAVAVFLFAIAQAKEKIDIFGSKEQAGAFKFPRISHKKTFNSTDTVGSNSGYFVNYIHGGS